MLMPLTTTSLALLTGACVALCGLLLLRRRRARGGGRAVFEVNPRYHDLLQRIQFRQPSLAIFE